MTIPAVYKFANWITGTPVPIDDAMTSALTPPIDTALQAALKAAAGGQFEVLTADRSYYINPATGNDSNDGLTVGTPWLTLQHAYDFVSGGIYFNGHIVTLNMAAGTYTTGISALIPCSGGGTFTFLGDTVTPSNVTISTTSATCFALTDSATSPTVFNLNGIYFTTTTGGSCINASCQCRINISNSEFGPVAGGNFHILAQKAGAFIGLATNYTISGGGGSGHISVSRYSYVFFTTGITVTITGTPSFVGGFFQCTQNSILNCGGAGTNFSGATTGPRYSCTFGGTIILPAAATETFLPGNSAGTTGEGAAVYANAASSYIEDNKNSYVPIISCLSANANLSNVNTIQQIFPTNGTLSVLPAKTYHVEMEFVIDNTTAVNAHTITITWGGTATITSSRLLYQTTSAAANTLAAVNSINGSVAGTVVTAAIAAEYVKVRCTGIIRTNAQGTLIPQLTYSAAPGAVPVIQANSFARLRLVGTNTFTDQGGWV